MDPQDLRSLLESVAAGTVDTDGAFEQLRTLPFSDIDVAKVDHHRALRCGFPEVIFCQGKTPGQVRSVARELLDHGDVVLATRASASQYQALAQIAPDARYFEASRLIVVDRRTDPPRTGHIVVASGGTADSPVAEEAAICAEVMGNRVTRVFDVGVAGLHRLLAHQETLHSARAIIAVAGMEGALPSLVAGLVSVPVIAVPTSVGYGVSFGGVAPLLTMLNSCASGIGVVNIDNGFGGAALASRINHTPPAEDSPADATPEQP
ncbi:MAG: nickel pincer cofactor biosynthesis protein LarB [Actinomycetota bacterium]|nr:nickel pincer cofactor biosynthesis protein LarB [Actinomycetota bacterium]